MFFAVQNGCFIVLFLDMAKIFRLLCPTIKPHHFHWSVNWLRDPVRHVGCCLHETLARFLFMDPCGKLPHESVQTFEPYLGGSSELSCVHHQVL